MISEAVKLYKQLATIDQYEIPIIVPVFNLVSYAEFMVNQLKKYNLNNFIICDNASSYPKMIDYLENLSKTERVVMFEENLGPRVFTERPEFLSIMPDYFIVTDPDLIFNENLPKNFINKMKRILNTYDVSKVGFAIDIEETKDKFFNSSKVKMWEGPYWQRQITKYEEKDPVYLAPIDTTFCLHDKEKIKNEMIRDRHGIAFTSAIRIAGRFTCQHMGWWKEQPLESEELEAYSKNNKWGSTDLGFVPGV